MLLVYSTINLLDFPLHCSSYKFPNKLLWSQLSSRYLAFDQIQSVFVPIQMATAADIITYIGMPLAVLGVSPILYNFLIAFFVKWSIQRKISAVSLQKDVVISIRLMNSIAQVELPIYHISLDNIPPHPAGIRARIRARASGQKKIWMNRTPNVGILFGGSWIPLTYDNDQDSPVSGQTNLRTCLRRS